MNISHQSACRLVLGELDNSKVSLANSLDNSILSNVLHNIGPSTWPCCWSCLTCIAILYKKCQMFMILMKRSILFMNRDETIIQFWSTIVTLKYYLLTYLHGWIPWENYLTEQNWWNIGNTMNKKNTYIFTHYWPWLISLLRAYITLF